MSHHGRVLVVEECPHPETRRLWDGIRARGWDVDAAPLAGLLDRTEPAAPDVLVLNFAASDDPDDRGRYLDAVAHLADRTGNRPLPVIAVEEGEAEPPPSGLDEVMRAPWSASHLAARIGSLARLAVMRAEYIRRIATERRRGLPVPDPVPLGLPPEPHVLVVGAGIRYFVIEHALAPKATLVGAFTLDTALDYLERRGFDAIVLNLPLEDAIDFVEVLRRDPARFDLPVVVLTGETDPRLVEGVHDAGADDVVFADEGEAAFARRVEAAMIEHHLRTTLKAAHRRDRPVPMVHDLGTGLHCRGFLMDHLAGLCAEVRAGEERFTLIGLRVLDLAQINAEWEWAGGDAILRQIGSLIGRLVRGEDLAARAGGDRFAIVLPGTDAEGAEAVADRIVGVVEATAFLVPEASDPARVSLTVGIAEAGPADDADTLYARAFL